MSAFSNIQDKQQRGQPLTSLEFAVWWCSDVVAARKAAKELAGKDAALEICVMFLTNINTITEEKQTELVKHLRTAGMVELVDAVAVGGMASIFNEAQ